MALIGDQGSLGNASSSDWIEPGGDFHREMEQGDLGATERKVWKKLGEPMDALEFSASVKALLDDAVDYTDGFLAQPRAEATAMYRGDPLGNEEEGRSQIVMTEVRDTVLAMLPGLLRIFVSSEDVVEFVPTTALTVDLAEQQTAYINHVFHQDNPGFSILHSVFKDALVRKLGIVKWWYSTEATVSESDFTGLTQGQVAVLREDPTTEIVELRAGRPISLDGGLGPDGLPLPPQQVEAWDVAIRRCIPRNRIVVEALPPEEFLISRDARDVEKARCVAHRSMKTVSDLVALGYDPEEIEAHAGDGDIFLLNYEATVRNPSINSFIQSGNPDPALREVLYVESFVRIDKDGDGIAELRRVCSIGNAHHVLHDEVVDEAPFALFCPDPEPHMVVGQSIADWTGDLQRLKTNLMRGTLDSLAQSIHPRTAIVEGMVNVDDALNTEVGGIIRTRQIGAVQPFTLPFVGQSALPVIAYVDQTASKRTGVSPASQGLDPDVLQSTTDRAVAATVNGAQERTELIARIFAESGMTRLFKGLLKLAIKHQDKPRVLKLCGKWVEIDPRVWDIDLECRPNVALGKGTDQDKMNMLGTIAHKQEQILQTLGPLNPICTLQEYRNTLAQIANLAGFKDATRYFKPVGAADLQQLVHAPPRPPDPRMALVQVEQAKAQGEAQSALLKHQLHQAEVAAKLQQQKTEFAINAMLRLAEIEAKYGVQGYLGQLQAFIDRDIAARAASRPPAGNG
jgi:hypothetical protein